MNKTQVVIVGPQDEEFPWPVPELHVYGPFVDKKGASKWARCNSVVDLSEMPWSVRRLRRIASPGDASGLTWTVISNPGLHPAVHGRFSTEGSAKKWGHEHLDPAPFEVVIFDERAGER
jgi:hypothetical protein